MICDFRDVVKQSSQTNYALAAFNVFGYEDAAAVVEAAEEMNAPILLATNKLAIDHMPVDYWGMLLRQLAVNAKVPVSIHLDHAKSYEITAKAIQSGYTSVMYDGSHLPLEENIRNTKEIARMAHAFDVAVEGEVGQLSYQDIPGNQTVYTNSDEALVFVQQTNVDWLAVSVGTVQRMSAQEASIQFELLDEIDYKVRTPLVIHGSTGIKDEDLERLVRTSVSKMNIGTALRKAFGYSLQEEVQKAPHEYDRLKLFEKPIEMVKQEALRKLELLGFKRAEDKVIQ
ncbi:class II fructose-bisphosphate aldolase [Halobacillus sp. Cin3]|uniref:class II fructose-bisphosphate aldolase n=1 Tax=Halobacillus sp. Cin3 TaxID=2928441 RepID=UPI00248DD740|nr:class II fructose-bisphosphate aldolase [Halobacillus sp. Cin3]